VTAGSHTPVSPSARTVSGKPVVRQRRGRCPEGAARRTDARAVDSRAEHIAPGDPEQFNFQCIFCHRLLRSSTPRAHRRKVPACASHVSAPAECGAYPSVLPHSAGTLRSATSVSTMDHCRAPYSCVPLRAGKVRQDPKESPASSCPGVVVHGLAPMARRANRAPCSPFSTPGHADNESRPHKGDSCHQAANTCLDCCIYLGLRGGAGTDIET
jgi:hypothetical protein